MKILLLSLLLLVTWPLYAAETSPAVGSEPVYLVTAELWARPRSAAAVADMQPVRQAVQSLISRDNARLVMRFPGGEDGSIWAEELQSWLVALGIDPIMIEMRPGSDRSDQIELTIQGNNL